MFQPSCPHYLACPRNRKGVYADKKTTLVPEDGTEVCYRYHGDRCVSRWDCAICCDMLLEGGVVRPFHVSRFFLFFFFFCFCFFFLIHLTPSEVTSGETIAYCRDSSWPWGEWGENSLSYMKYLVTDQPAWSLKKQDGDCSREFLITSHRFPR